VASWVVEPTQVLLGRPRGRHLFVFLFFVLDRFINSTWNAASRRADGSPLARSVGSLSLLALTILGIRRLLATAGFLAAGRPDEPRLYTYAGAAQRAQRHGSSISQVEL
jgi:hypothetical protein